LFGVGNSQLHLDQTLVITLTYALNDYANVKVMFSAA